MYPYRPTDSQRFTQYHSCLLRYVLLNYYKYHMIMKMEQDCGRLLGLGSFWKKITSWENDRNLNIHVLLACRYDCCSQRVCILETWLALANLGKLVNLESRQLKMNQLLFCPVSQPAQYYNKLALQYNYFICKYNNETVRLECCLTHKVPLQIVLVQSTGPIT